MKEIPTPEFHERVARVQQELHARDLDALITFSNEAEPANVRYFCDYWPAFETAAVVIPAEGEALLLIGPESGTYATARSRLPGIRKLIEFRESSDPEYPGAHLDTFESVFSEIAANGHLRNLAVAGLSIMSVPVYLGIKRAMGERPIIEADDILMGMRMVKSKNELDLMRQAYKLAEHGLTAALQKLRPGMTEIQVAAEAQYAMLSAGAEATAFPIWCISGPNTNQAISRSTHRQIQSGDLVQLCVGARVGGYCSSVSRPCVVGEPTTELLELIEVGLKAADLTRQTIKAGVAGSEVATVVASWLTDAGYGDYILYGPGHGVGLMECEYPFIETSYTEPLKENMTFAVDTWLSKGQVGIRFEDGIRVAKSGVEELSSTKRSVLTVG
jgi:Xaa-Pro aminopeptidase